MRTSRGWWKNRLPGVPTGLEVAVDVGHLADFEVGGAGCQVGLRQRRARAATGRCAAGRPDTAGRRCPRGAAPRRSWFAAAARAAVRLPAPARRSCRRRPDRAGCRAGWRPARRRRGGRTWPVAPPATPATPGAAAPGPRSADRSANRCGPSPGTLQFRVALELGDGRVVQSPVGAGQLGVAVGRQPHRQAGERRMLRVAFGQFPQHAEHRLLHARMRARCSTAPVRAAAATRRTSRSRRRRSTRCPRRPAPPARRIASNSGSGAANSTRRESVAGPRGRTAASSISSTSLRTGSWAEAKNAPVS